MWVSSPGDMLFHVVSFSVHGVFTGNAPMNHCFPPSPLTRMYSFAERMVSEDFCGTSERGFSSDTNSGLPLSPVCTPVHR